MKLQHILLLILTLIYNILPMHAEYFRNLNLNDGLSQVSVMSICQDNLGRMWFGTKEGINVYDGRHIRYYKGWINNGADRPLWLGNDVEYVCKGTDGNMYMLIDKNIFRYDIREERFQALTNGNATPAMTASDKGIWYVKNDSVFRWVYQTRHPQYLCQSPSEKITTLTLSSDGHLYIGTREGVFIADTIRASKNWKQILKHIEIYSIFESSQKEIWIGTRMQGLFRLNDGKLTEVPYSPTDGKGISDLQIREFTEDDQHNIWFGTFSGLQKFDQRTEKYSKIQIPQYVGGLNHPSVFSLYKDRQGIIWVGSYYGGASYFNPNKEEFLHYNYQVNSKRSIYYSYIGEMAKDKHGNLWLSTDGGGISCMDADWNLLSQFTSDQAHSIPHNNIKSIAYDSINDYLFIGTYLGGLSKYDIGKKQFHNYLHAPGITDNPGNVIYHLKMWQGNLYFTSRKGVFMLNPRTDRLTHLSTHGGYCEYFDIDNQGNIYIMGWNYIHILPISNPSQNKFIRLSDYGCKGSLSRILSTDEGVYICTLGSGIFFLSHTDRKVTNYTRSNSQLPSDYCYNIKQVDAHNLVVTSDKGVSLFNPQSKKCSTINLTSEHSVINGCGIFVSPEHHIYIGDTKGVTFFPQEAFLNNNEKSMPLYFSNLWINNQPISPQGKDRILQQALPFTHTLKLKHNQNNCIIQFSFSDYKNNNHRQLFEYKLQGFDKKWITTPVNEIHYTNLDPGKYTLLVRYLHDSNQQAISLDIHISSPWYNTWWAWLLYAIIAVSSITYFIHNRLLKRTLSLSLEKERFEKQHIEEMNHAKLVFFTNVSHEFRTPLTLIISHIDSLLQEQLPVQLYNKVMKIKQNAQYMTNLVTELLDFRKFTQNHVTLQVYEQNICAFLKEIYLSFADYAKQRSIEYTFNADPETINCWIDRKQLEKVFFNLLSNAFKYTPDGKSIHVCLSVQTEHVVIRITDSGMGIAENEVSRVFDRFFQGKNQKGQESAPGTGIGLALTKSIVETHHGSISVESELHKGSSFTVSLPLNKEVYLSDNKVQFVTPSPEELKISGTDISTDVEIHPAIPLPDENSLLQEQATDDDREKKRAFTLLLVEDNPELMEVLKHIFIPFYHIVTATNGKEGLSATFEYKPDIIISDIMMPEMNGTEMCLQIKNNIDLCHIPVILLTALNSAEQNIEGLNRGADDYITKPFNAQILLARANNLVRNRLLIQHQLDKKPMSEVDLTSINPLDQEILRKTVDIIEKHIDDIEFDIPKLCREIGMGRSQLYSKFKALTGMTPNNFLLNYRLKYAASMLQKYPTLPVAEVSDRSGFNSPVYFSRCFKSQYGQTPQSYRREQQELQEKQD